MKILKTDYHKLNSKPAADGFHMPAEYEEQYGCLMIWPYREGSWNYKAKRAREVFSVIIKKIAECEKVFVFARKEDIEDARNMLYHDNKIIAKNILLYEMDTDDAWARDTGATFVIGNNERRGIDWQFNAWGGEYDGLYASWDKDQKVASKICKLTSDKCYDASHFILEGGSICSDGEGTILTTEECLLSKGRNSNLTKEQIEEELKNYLGAEKIIWIPRGIYNDETNGHVDNMCAFVGPAEVVLAWTDDENDPQYERSREAYDILINTTDAYKRKLKVHKMLIPDKPVLISEEDLQGYVFEEGEDTREAGERLAASYVNFYICNKSVLVPQFGDINDKRALEVLKECFPDREIFPVYAMDILKGGGNIHCITQQIPALNRILLENGD